MAEINPNFHKPPEMEDKPPPYSQAAGEPDFTNAYGPPVGGFTQLQHGSVPQPHIFVPPPSVGYQLGPNATVPNYGAAVPVYGTAAPTQIIVVGGCPACRIGVLEDEFTFCGVCLAIVLFPLGLLCCLAMKQRRCPNCGATFG